MPRRFAASVEVTWANFGGQFLQPLQLQDTNLFPHLTRDLNRHAYLRNFQLDRHHAVQLPVRRDGEGFDSRLENS